MTRPFVHVHVHSSMRFRGSGTCCNSRIGGGLPGNVMLSFVYLCHCGQSGEKNELETRGIIQKEDKFPKANSRGRRAQIGSADTIDQSRRARH